MKRIKFVLSLIILPVALACTQERFRVISVSENIELTKLSDQTYIHTTYAHMQPFGRVASNGMIFVNKGKAFLFDTPSNDTLTESLVKWIEKELHAEIIAVVPNHWHADCMGGLGYIHRHKIQSFAYDLTRKMAKEKRLPVPSRGFPDSLVLKLGKEKVVCKYFGPAHTADNITAWIPSEKILFGGCMIKSMDAGSLGNTADADTAEWPSTLKKVMSAYPDAKIVIPGHGKYGGIELIRHTLDLLANNRKKPE
jgi:metallo-beta-lactamase class B